MHRVTCRIVMLFLYILKMLENLFAYDMPKTAKVIVINETYFNMLFKVMISSVSVRVHLLTSSSRHPLLISALLALC